MLQNARHRSPRLRFCGTVSSLSLDIHMPILFENHYDFRGTWSGNRAANDRGEKKPGAIYATCARKELRISEGKTCSIHSQRQKFSTISAGRERRLKATGVLGIAPAMSAF
jgi:hypothetical protein